MAEIDLDELRKLLATIASQIDEAEKAQAAGPPEAQGRGTVIPPVAPLRADFAQQAVVGSLPPAVAPPPETPADPAQAAARVAGAPGGAPVTPAGPAAFTARTPAEAEILRSIAALPVTSVVDNRQEPFAAGPESPFIGKGVMRETNFPENAPGNVPVPSFIKDEALATSVAENPPPTADPTRGGPYSVMGANETAANRHYAGLRDEFAQPNATSGVVRALKTLGRQIPILGSLVPDTEAFTFEDVSLDDIVNDPEINKRWQTLSKQEQAFALFDGSDKGWRALQLGDAEWARVFGSTKTQVKEGYAVHRRTPGVVGGPGGGGARAAGAGGPGGARGAAQTAGGLAGEPSLGVSYLPVDNPREVHQYISRTDPNAGIENFANEQFAGSAELRENFVKMEGTMVQVLRKVEGKPSVPDWAPREQVALFPQIFDREADRGPRAVVTKDGTRGFMSDAQIYAQPYGGVVADATRNYELTEKQLEREISLESNLTQYHVLRGPMSSVGPRGLGAIGKAGVALSQFASQFGFDIAGETISKFLSGGELSTKQLGTIQKLFGTFALRRKMAILNDMKLSNKDVVLLLNAVDAASSIATPERAGELMDTIQTLEIVNDALKKSVLGTPQLFPMETKAEYDASLERLKQYGFPEGSAVRVMDELGNNPRLRPKTVYDAAASPVGSLAPDEEDENLAP